MNISILLMEQIIQLFLMIFMGYLIVKVRLVKDEDSKVLSKIILYLIIPCVIINAFQVDYTMDTVKGLLLALAASVMTQVLLLIIISIAGKLLHLNEVEIASVYYSNSGNLIVPIVTFILGQDWVLYGCVFMSVQLIFLWTHCKKIISRESSYDWKKIVLNINMISIFIGVVLFGVCVFIDQSGEGVDRALYLALVLYEVALYVAALLHKVEIIQLFGLVQLLAYGFYNGALGVVYEYQYMGHLQRSVLPYSKTGRYTLDYGALGCAYEGG